MVIDKETGLLSVARYCPSPHCDQRPNGQVPSLIVVHAISLPPGIFAGNDVVDFFQGKLDTSQIPYYAQLSDVRVSAHLFIRRSGEVVQCVPFHIRAWHAGHSRFATQTHVNDFSVGIELEGTDTAPFTDAQYRCLNRVTAVLRQTYPSMEQAPVVGHSDVAPVRKTDPGLGFDWSRVL